MADGARFASDLPAESMLANSGKRQEAIAAELLFDILLRSADRDLRVIVIFNVGKEAQ